VRPAYSDRMKGHARTSVVLAALLLVSACGGADEQPEPGDAPATTGAAAPTGDGTTAPDDASGTSGGGLASLTPTFGSPGGQDDGPKEITIGAAGDILPHAPVIENARLNAGGRGYDFGPMFADVTALLTEPDLTLCHLETPLSPDNTGLTVPRTLVFNSPREVADALAGAGFDGCDFASNHTLDRGISGLANTVRVLGEAGLEYAGPAPEDGPVTPTVFEVDGTTVAQLAYSYTAYNSGVPNTDVPGEAPWLRQYLWPAVGAEGILADAEAAREDGADFVVVSLHWGNEYWTEPTEQQRELAADLLESDAVDLIVGTHVHVIQPCEKINGKYVLYGLGNFLSNQSPDTTRGKLRKETQEGMIAHVTLTRDAEGTVSSRLLVQPTRVQIDNHVIRLATPEQHAETYQRVLDTMDLLGEGSCDAEPLP
jgi:poly-gamma-glutamate capsule biosynthesis protein CapA/YwtB (metallophosphatase superfamily)